MKAEIQINNSVERCHIDIEGVIGVPEEWQFENPAERVATYEKFRDAVRRIGEIQAPEVVVNIRSTGGDVNDALLIHDALRQTGAHITTRCYGYTASAATIIAQAADEGCRQLSENALYLIHASVCATEGNAVELEEKSALLRQTDERLASLYATRSGRSVEEFEALMAENKGNGRWLSPEEALAAGLADQIIAPSPEQKGSLSQNLAHGWGALLAKIGLQKQAEMPSDRNILHFEEQVEKERIAQRQRAVQASQRIPCEDPSFGEPVLRGNSRAYAEDAKLFRK